MALFAQRTLQFVRAPDENVFIARTSATNPPKLVLLLNTKLNITDFPLTNSNAHLALNLIEIFLLIIPFEWWLPSARYERLNHYVMGIIYSPLLLITALIETLNARRIRLSRRLGEEDDDILQEWEEAAQNLQVDFQAENWDLKVADTKPNVELDPCVLEIRELKGQVAELMGSVKRLKEQVEGVRRGSDGGTVVNGVDEVGVTGVSSRDGNGEDTGPVNGEEGGLTEATEAGGDATGEPRE